MHYFHMKTKILADFQICIGVPLTKSITYVPLFQNKPWRQTFRPSTAVSSNQNTGGTARKSLFLSLFLTASVAKTNDLLNKLKITVVYLS